MIESLDVSQKTASPFLTIWYQPRKTFRYIVDTMPNTYVIPIILVYGIVSGVSDRYTRIDNYCRDNIILRGKSPFDYPSTLIWGMVEGVAMAFIFLSLAGKLYPWIGKWFKGESEAGQARAVYAWSSLPDVVAGLFSMPVIIFLINKVFACQLSEFPTNPMLGVYILAGGGFTLVGLIWGFIIRVIGLSEIMGITKGRALITAIIGNLILFIVDVSYEFYWRMMNY